MKIEVANGEIVDRVSILEIKLNKIKDQSKIINIQKEYDLLKEVMKNIISTSDELYQALYSINEKLWEIEDEIRLCEKNKDFGDKFIRLARAVYKTNDERSKVKRQINLKTGSELIDEKQYTNY